MANVMTFAIDAPRGRGWRVVAWWEEDARGTIVIRALQIEPMGKMPAHGIDSSVMSQVGIVRLRSLATRAYMERRDGRSDGRRRLTTQLRIPTSVKKPDAFYRQVAALGTTGVTAGEIAAANDVPVTTVYRWRAEARRRGILPRGRAGARGG